MGDANPGTCPGRTAVTETWESPWDSEAVPFIDASPAAGGPDKDGLGLTTAVRRFLAEEDPVTPCLVVDLSVVAARYRALTTSLPGASIYYAAKANPLPEVLGLLVDLGACFDVASVGEIEACLAAGAAPSALSYGNTIKKQADIARAYESGIRLFAFDSEEELEKLAAAAPGSEVFCRILTDNSGADWPLSRKFGCEPPMAVDLLVRAAAVGLRPIGVSFHVGSQQRDPAQWDVAVRAAAGVFERVARHNIELELLNLGGGFPADYGDDLPTLEAYGASIRAAIDRHLPGRNLRIIAEPGRFMTADAGVILSEVVLVSRKSYTDQGRWVFLDVGIFGGLVEAIGEAIRYPIRTSRDGDPVSPVVLAGPTCDSMDVLYERERYQLPESLRAGDLVAIDGTGAYTFTYCSVGFNGFLPLRTHCI